MAGGVVASVLAPHTPRMADESGAPEFVRGLVGGLRELGEGLRALEPDVLVVASAHWVCTFHWYVTRQAVHEGVCVAEEAPDLIPGIAYRRPGDPAFADALLTAAGAAGLPCRANDTPHFAWDYGLLVPLLYLDPAATLPVVALPTCLSADFAECARVGEAVHAAAASSGRRVVFVASCALSHSLVRTPAQWPSEERRQLDARLVGLLCAGRAGEALDWLPEYNRQAVAEMGGRPLAVLLGALRRMAAGAAGRQYGPYCPSSGSGNAAVGIGAGLG